MPEGPEVRTITEALNSRLKGKTLVSFGWSKGLSKNNCKRMIKYSDFSKLLPMKIDGVTCKGKQIFFIFSGKETKMDGSITNKKMYLNSTMGMSGVWLFKEKLHILSDKKKKHTNFWINTGISSNVKKNDGSPWKLNIIKDVAYFNDFRKHGNLFIMDEAEFRGKINKLGNDVLTENITTELWKAKCDLRPDWQICKFLMDQRYFCGIGNYLKAEILYRSKVRPNRLISSLNETEMNDLRKNSMKVIRDSYRSRGVSVRDYVDPNGNKGSYTFVLQVYKKKTDPLGNPVVTGEFDDKRVTHWVAAIQK